MDKITVFLLLALNILQEYHLCSGMVVRGTTGSGGKLDGDPAPGRSPGPPHFVSPHHRNLEGQPTLILTSETSDVDCNLDGELTTTTEIAEMNVTIDHHLFKTDVLVPGVIYQGMV